MRAFITGLVLLLAPLMVYAVQDSNNEPDHLYEVEGYILDADRNPLITTEISISSGNQIIGSTRSDNDGYYTLKLHLHDSSIGRELVLTTPQASQSIIMSATMGDRVSRRQHFANFIGNKLVEGQLEDVGTSLWLYYVGGLLGTSLLIAAAFVGLRKGRKSSSSLSRKRKHSSKRRHRRRRST